MDRIAFFIFARQIRDCSFPPAKLVHVLTIRLVAAPRHRCRQRVPDREVYMLIQLLKVTLPLTKMKEGYLPQGLHKGTSTRMRDREDQAKRMTEVLKPAAGKTTVNVPAELDLEPPKSPM